ncbi:hypothetical protein [Streptomyces griseus]|uniref:hypothetical protein n=1 Tax=Streptomyces griseus TaxID=1911 RepID=UPI0005696F26|nr:hypothetical protein [Streptomyces griseus]
MGIESDQVVFEYLSRVGDVAQQRQLPSAARMRLVSELRNEIDRRRAKAPVDSPAAVRRIIDRLGSPDDVVSAASGGARSVPRAPAPAVPVQRDGETREERPKGIRRVVPRPRQRPAAPSRPVSDGPAPPHLASAQELGSGVSRPDWWQSDGGSSFGLGDEVPGFVGGVEIPDLLKPPPPKERPEEAKAAVTEEAVAEVEVVEEPVVKRRIPRFRRGSWSNPLLLLAACCLVAGAVLGNWFVLILGWLIAYASRRLTAAESKWAVMGLPGLAVTAGLVWLWGRTNGRWGTPIAEGHLNEAVAQTWPWVVRGAAVASALFLVWRSQRQK